MGWLSSAIKSVGGFLTGGWPGAIGTGLELLGAGKQLFGRGEPGPGQQSYAQLMGAAKAADELGLHRSLVAGSPAGYSPAPMSQAQGLLNAGSALRQGRPSPKENELLDAQIEEARSRTILNNANAVRAFHGPQPGIGGNTTALGRAFDRLANGGERGIRREPEPDMPATQTVTLGDRTARGPNPEAFEVGMSELIAGGLIYGSQWMIEELRRLEAANRPKHERRPNRDTRARAPRYPVSQGRRPQ